MSDNSKKVKKRPSLGTRLSSAAQAIKRSFSPIPKYPYEPSNDDTTPPTGILDDIQKLGFQDVDTLLTFLNAAVTGVENDNNLLLEHLIQLLAKLPPTSEDGKQLGDGFVNQLWNSLSHPPPSVVGAEYRYREADGSNNNIRMPKLGAANTPYARSASPVIIQSPNLPDPGDIFDALMSRGKTWNPHPNKISSTLFYLATIIIHDLFQTDPSDNNLNTTSSYLDLAPLYGRNQTEQDAMRTFKDGLLKPDCFSSKRVLGFPPGVGVMLIMFNRFHNYVVTQLAIINEAGRFNKPKADADADAWKKHDNDLFQTGRLITCGLYVNIILRDYVRTILNLNQTPSSWALDPRTQEGKNILSNPAPEGTGNQVSAEFNVIYRWHSAISQKDEKWTEGEFARLLGGRDPATISPREFVGLLAQIEAAIPDDPLQRPFADLTRNADDNTLPDDPLVDLWVAGVEDIAGSFGANRVPDILKPVEVLGIIQARYWQLGTLNEFREFFGLTKHATFEDINPDAEVARRLRQLYDSPDSVELYPGLVAEKAKPVMVPGSGLCVNYTTSRAILSDAVTLVRGDRFYTIDYTPKSLTNWGFSEVAYDATVDRTHVIYKLVFRAFPNYFANNSIYAHFPFTIPSENKVILDKLSLSDQYSWAQPSQTPELVIIQSHKATISILDNQKDFKVTWGAAINFLVSQPGHPSYGKDFCLAGDEPANTANRALVRKGLYPTAWEKEVWKWYAETAPKLFEKYSYEVAGDGKTREVDIVRDVANLTNTRFNAALFSLPIKTDESPRGLYTEQELYLVCAVLFSAIFFDADIANSFKLRTTAKGLADQLGQIVTLTAQAVSKAEVVADVIGKLEAGSAPTLKDYGVHLLDRLLQKAKSVDEAVWGTIMPLLTANVVNQSQVLSQCVDYYLGDGKAHLPELYELAHANTPEADEKLMKYMLEGCRLRGGVALYRDLATSQTIIDSAPCLPNPANPSSQDPVTNPDPTETTISLSAGRRILVDLLTAGHDPTAFPDPEVVKTDRPLDSYIHFGWGPHQCAGMEVSRVAQTGLFKAIVGRKGLRRAPGPRGELKSMPARVWNGQVGTGAKDQVDSEWTGLRIFMTADQSGVWPVPSTMKVRWDEE